MSPGDIGVVIVGRNEGERFAACLASLVGRDHLAVMVYVDSGSTDGSVELARSNGLEVVELDMSRPSYVARARSEGFARLKQIAPGLPFLLFVDGDCEVVDGWIDRAKAELEARPDAAAVCGRRREKAPEASIFNRLADLEWDTPIGETLACAGDALMRTEAYEQVGGYNPTITSGEEPELCTRLRKAGWKIWRVDADMTRHDLAMTSPRQWWRRHYRSGYGGLDVTTRFPGEPRLFVAELRRARIWGAALPAAGLTAGAIAGMMFGPIAGLAMVGATAMAYPLQVVRLAIRVRPKVINGRTALAYGYHYTIAKWANLAGQIAYLRDRRRGLKARLVMYKPPGPGEATR